MAEFSDLRTWRPLNEGDDASTGPASAGGEGPSGVASRGPKTRSASRRPSGGSAPPTRRRPVEDASTQVTAPPPRLPLPSWLGAAFDRSASRAPGTRSQAPTLVPVPVGQGSVMPPDEGWELELSQLLEQADATIFHWQPPSVSPRSRSTVPARGRPSQVPSVSGPPRARAMSLGLARREPPRPGAGARANGRVAVGASRSALPSLGPASMGLGVTFSLGPDGRPSETSPRPSFAAGRAFDRPSAVAASINVSPTRSYSELVGGPSFSAPAYPQEVLSAPPYAEELPLSAPPYAEEQSLSAPSPDDGHFVSALPYAEEQSASAPPYGEAQSASALPYGEAQPASALPYAEEAAPLEGESAGPAHAEADEAAEEAYAEDGAYAAEGSSSPYAAVTSFGPGSGRQMPPPLPEPESDPAILLSTFPPPPSSLMPAADAVGEGDYLDGEAGEQEADDEALVYEPNEWSPADTSRMPGPPRRPNFGGAFATEKLADRSSGPDGAGGSSRRRGEAPKLDLVIKDPFPVAPRARSGEAEAPEASGERRALDAAMELTDDEMALVHGRTLWSRLTRRRRSTRGCGVA